MRTTDTPTYKLENVVKSSGDRLENFEGPLDLILSLLSKNKIEIRDIQISVILEQYLTYLSEMERMDMEITSEFISMASHLVYLKTRTLLAADNEELLSEMEQLMRILQERKNAEIFKSLREAVPTLSQLYSQNSGMYVKPQEPLGKSYRYSHKPDDLKDALVGIVEKDLSLLPPPAPMIAQIVPRNDYPVSVKAADILRNLARKGKSLFRALFKTSRSRSEIIATFLALLELCRKNRVELSGEGDEIEVSYVPEKEA